MRIMSDNIMSMNQKQNLKNEYLLSKALYMTIKQYLPQILAFPKDMKMKQDLQDMQNLYTYQYNMYDPSMDWENGTELIEGGRLDTDNKLEEQIVLNPCYVCNDQVEPEDIFCYKKIDGIIKPRHFWHNIQDILKD